MTEQVVVLLRWERGQGYCERRKENVSIKEGISAAELAVPSFGCKEEASQGGVGVLVCLGCFWAAIRAEPLLLTDEVCWELSVRKSWCGSCG